MKRLFLLFLLPLVAMAQTSSDDVSFKEVRPPNPSTTPPQGWQITEFPGKTFKYSTKLQNGREITLSMTAYQLVPAGADVAYFLEPGYDGKSADKTLSNLLNTHGTSIDATIAQLKTLSAQLGQISKKP